jgi:HK97 family phage major capsid protein
MSEFITAQREARANLIMQVREVIETAETEKRGLVAEDAQKIARIEADIEKLDESIGFAERSELRRAEAETAGAGRAPVVPVESRGAADVFRALASGEQRSHTFNFEKRAAVVPGVNTVPVSFLDRVYGIARLVGPMLETSEVIQRTSGESLRIPTWTAYSTAAITAAGSAIATSNPTFDSTLLTPRKTSFIVQLANELVVDAGYDIETAVVEQAGNAIGFSVNNLTTVGTGTTEAFGIVTSAGSGVLAGTTAFTADNLIDLAYSVDGAARRLPGVGYMANTNTLGRIRKLKDDDGAYIYNVVGTGPDTVLGFPVFENPAMASVATGAKSVIFGHLPSYKIATTGLDVTVSTDAYFENDVTAWRFTYRFDGALPQSTHVKYLVHA